MKKIITVTLHPSIDEVEIISSKIDNTASGQRNVKRYPAGKGINVSRTLSCMGVPSVAIAVIGQQDVAFFDTLKDEYITPHWITTPHPTRQNHTVYNEDKGTEEHERKEEDTTDEFPTAEVTKALLGHCRKDDIVVLAGSLPHNAPKTILRNLCRVCQEKGAKVMIDAWGAPLLLAADAHPYMVKNNLEELAATMDCQLNTENELTGCLSKYWDKLRSKAILISRGAEGVLMYDQITDYFIKGKVDVTPDLKSLHTVGSGDAMMAGFCAEMLKSADHANAMVMSLATATANLYTDVPGKIDAGSIRSFMSQTTVMVNGNGPLCRPSLTEEMTDYLTLIKEDTDHIG